MSTITKERVAEFIKNPLNNGLTRGEQMELARIALASLEAEAVCYLTWHQGFRAPDDCEEYVVEAKPGDKSCDGSPAFPVYAAPPAPVSDEDKVLAEQARAVVHCLDMCGVPSGDYADNEQLQLWGRVIEYGRHPASVSVPDGYRLQPISEYDAMCAAMLQGSQPVSKREQVRREHAEWSDKTFGDVGPVGPLKHLSKEALEAAAEPDDLSEWADMQFLLWDAQRRAGISDGEITAAMEEKLKVNMARQWPEPKDGEPRQHIKPAPQPVPDSVISAAVNGIMATYAENAEDCRAMVRTHVEQACRAAIQESGHG